MAGGLKKPWSASSDYWLPAFVNVDQYEGRMDHNAHKRPHHLDLDLETQLIDEHSFDDFRKNEGLIMPSEDEASKETQLIHGGDEGHSGSSSGKDGEVDSALSPFDSAAFSQKQSHWLSEFTGRDRTVASVSGRAFQGRPSLVNSPFRERYLGETQTPFRDRYLGETQILSDDGNVLEALNNSGKDHKNFADPRDGGAGACAPDLQNRDVDLPHFLRDFDPNRQDYAGQATVGTWQEVTGQSEDRGWETAVRDLQLLDSDASTEDEEQNRNNGVFNTDISYPGEGQMPQNVNPRLSTRVSNLFCKQDLNKSPEPEFMMDGWEEENRADLGIGRIDEGGSNVDLLQVAEPGVLQSTPMETKISEGLSGRIARVLPSTARTGGSIRAASLRASALQASSCSSSRKYRHSTPQGSKSEEVQNSEKNSTIIEMPSGVVPQKARGSSGDTSDMSKITMERGHSAASLPSVVTHSNEATGSPRIDKTVEAAKVMDSVDAKVRELSKVGASVHAEASSVLEIEVSKPASEQSPSGTRKLKISGDGSELEKHTQITDDNRAVSHGQPASEKVGPRKENEVEPLPTEENYSSPRKASREKSLERRSSFGSGLFSTGSDMSYLSTQSPGEDSQARALNMVDKLVWLNNIGLPQEILLQEEKAPPKSGPSTNAKSLLQSRVQVAEAKAGMDDPFGVFDWVDSQDEPFGGGTGNVSANKGASKAVVDVGQSNKQSGMVSKRGGGAEMPGSRTKKAEKVSEKSKFVKPTPIADKHKGLAAKVIPGGIEAKREQLRQGGRSGNGFGAMDIRQDLGGREPTDLDFASSHQDRVGSGATDQRSGLCDKESNKFGATDSSSTADRLRHVPALKGPLVNQQRSKPAADLVRCSSDVRLEHSKDATQASKPSPTALDGQKGTGESASDSQADGPQSSEHREDNPPSAQGGSTSGPTAFRDAQASVLADASVGNGGCGLHETSAPYKTEEGGLIQQDTGDANFSHQAVGNNDFKTTDDTPERIPRMLEKAAGRSLPLLKDGSGELAPNVGHVEDLPAVSPNQSPTNNKVVADANDQANLHQLSGPQQQSDESDIEEGGHFEGVENYHGSSKPIFDVTKLDSTTDRSYSRLSGHLERSSSLASVTVPTTDQSEGRDSLAKSPNQDAGTGPAAAEAQIEEIEISPGSSPTAGSRQVSPEQGGVENVPITSETVSLGNDIEGEGRKAKIEYEIQSAPPKKATRRGRSQTRYSARPLENADPPSGSNSIVSREKGRGRRVTWAGSLVEQTRRQSIGVRRPRSPKLEIEPRDEDVADSSHEIADSSGQEEDAEDLQEVVLKSENGSRKGNSEAMEISSRFDDLGKIKRRFNMSDAAVARLLGTDEDEDPDLINEEPTGVKVRSLNHIHPEADGNGDDTTVPNFRRVSKGLRSVRSRSEEGARRPWPFTSSDQSKLNVEDVISAREQSAVTAGNMNGTVTGDGHPSDNEFMNGRRRMRSIADVSFSNLPQTTPGRPPLARGLRRKRGRHVVISRPEVVTDPSDDDLPPSVPAPLMPLLGRFRGKGGPRSARRRKEPELDPMPSTSEVSMSPNSSKEASPTSFKRRRRTGAISVLLSHGLNEDTIKHQRKIVAKLGGRGATSASECSHFVADKFVRTGNMLEAMASGKPVVNIGWLETCSEANRFVDEEEFILQDTKKEEEMGFSMMSTLAAARQRPLLQGIRVYITPGTSPGPDSLARIVKSAGGQVVDQYDGPAADGEQESNFCIVISSEEEFEDCIPLLEQGAKVYTPELILSGVTSYHIDFSNDQLFRNFTVRRRRGSSSRRTT